MPQSVGCPECGTTLEVDDEYRTWKVRCPQCRHEFYPADEGGRPTEDEPRPRRRRRREYDDEDDDPRAAAADVAAPALWLELTGWGSLLLLLVMCGILIVAGVVGGNQKPPPGQDPPELFIFLGTCLGVIGLPYFGVIIYGARKLRNLSGRGWAMAGAILAVASLALFGLCGLPIIGPGIWALVVMNRPHVQAAFRRNARRGSPRYDEDDE